MYAAVTAAAPVLAVGLVALVGWLATRRRGAR
jgi:hypothetical protein